MPLLLEDARPHVSKSGSSFPLHEEMNRGQEMASAAGESGHDGSGLAV